MPAIVVAAIITAAAKTTASVVAARSESGSSKRAADVQLSANADQLAFEKEQAAEARAEWEREQTEAKAQWDAEQAKEETQYGDTLAIRQAEFALAKQKYTDRQSQMAPYRAAGVGALAQLATLSGVAGPPAQAASPAPLLDTMPKDWKAGDPVTAGTSKATTTAETTDTTDRSFLDNPQLLPPTSAPEPTVIDAPAATAATAPSMASAAYQGLAAPRPAVMGALTPGQVAALVRAGRGGASLSALARSRRAQVYQS